MGFYLNLGIVTGAPSTRKWPMAPESEIAYSVAIISLFVLYVFCDLLEMKTVSSSFLSLFANSANLLLLNVLVFAMVVVDLGYA